MAHGMSPFVCSTREGRGAEMVCSRWGEEVTEGKIKAAGGKGNEISASPLPSPDISNCRRSATLLRFPRQERRNCSNRKAVAVGGMGLSRSCCCLLQERLCLLSALSGAEVVGCSTGMQLGWDAGSFADDAGGLGGLGEDRLCCRCVPDVSASSGEWSLGAR